jgi:hypothetical protein
MKKNQKIKASEHIGVHAFQLGHAMQLPRLRRGQTVLLTAGHRAKLPSIH